MLIKCWKRISEYENFSINYTTISVQDLKDIFIYISVELKEPTIAENKINKIRNAVKELNLMPNRFPAVDFEAFVSMNIRKMTVDNFIIFYRVDEEYNNVTVLRILYSGRDIENLLKKS